MWMVHAPGIIAFRGVIEKMVLTPEEGEKDLHIDLYGKYVFGDER
jgi:hypothetical protein